MCYKFPEVIKKMQILLENKLKCGMMSGGRKEHEAGGHQ